MSERVMVIAAHPDDEILGCGGTMARHWADGDEVTCVFVADGETARIMAAQPNRNIAAFKVSQLLHIHPPVFFDLKDQRLGTVPLLDITQMIESQVEQYRPTIVYTHHHGDLNEDHRMVHKATMTALRPLPGASVRAIYGFEVLSSTEWGITFNPTHFVDIADFIHDKIAALKLYDDEMRPFPHPRSYSVVRTLARYRGSCVGVSAAEAFVTYRSIR
jgi:LmbE family N-acetylglucosaminyl deacetylase